MLYAIVAVLALIIDQAVKYWTTVNIVVDTGEAKLIPGFVHLANIHNTGAAFSFLEGARWFFVILCILFCLLVVYVLVKNIVSHPLARWMAVIVMAGAIGNCIDRIVCGYVVDMFEFDFLLFGKPFPVFNVADIYITVGAIIFCICILVDKPKAAKQNVPFSEGKAAAEKKAKPVLTRRQRTPIPDFPKRTPTEEPAINPEDPFAEWEAPDGAPAVGKTVYSQPAAAQKNYSKEAVDFVNLLSSEPPVAAEPAPAPAAKPQAPARPAAPAKPAAPAAVSQPAAPERPAAPAAPAAPKPQSETYNLDDILAEFRDL